MWYLSLLVFLDKRFKFEPYLCNGCHDLMQKAINFNNVAVVSVKGNNTEFISGTWAEMRL